MKGIILAGGLGTRLHPCTLVTNKHLLPVGDRPMIYFPLRTLVQAGVKEIMIVTGPEHSEDFGEVLGDGSKFGCEIKYALQKEPGGIAQALGLCEEFAGGESVMVILGDNVFEDDFGEVVNGFEGGGHVFLKEVGDARRFGVVELDESGKVLGIEEKPAEPKSNLAVTGCYIYDESVWEKIKNLQPSGRGELEITDVNNAYLEEGKLGATVLKGEWTDAGTFPSLYRASKLVFEHKIKTPF